jgi:FHA domain
MSIGLSQYAKRFLLDPAAREAHTLPILLWETVGTEEARDRLVLETRAGFPAMRPRAGEPLVFEVKKGGNKANAFAMGITVGRTEINDIPVDDDSVSRFHAWLQQDLHSGEWRLVDAESRNGTWVGPMRLKPNHPETLRPGAQLRFGNVEMTFLPPNEFFAAIAKRLGSPAHR